MTEKKFIDYVYRFYGPEGLYPIPTTREEIGLALEELKLAAKESRIININKSLTVKNKRVINIEYDSIDRERIRDIIYDKKKRIKE
jgi:hypothetical protein